MTDTHPNADFNALESRLTQACSCHEQGDYHRAEILYRDLIGQYPGIWQLHFNYGLLCDETGRYEEALENYFAGLAINPASEDLHYNIAICQKKLGRIEAAIDSYRRALEIAPDDIDCLYNLAGCYRSQGDDQRAARVYGEILERAPQHLPSLNNLAYVAHKNGDSAGARELYDKILALNPDHVSAEYMRAALSGETRSQPPDSYVKEVFDAFADHYEASLTANLGYELPSTLRDFYQRLLPRNTPERLLDLGCGTGLIGDTFQSFCQSMTGVDISEKMLDAAREKRLYDTLHLSAITDFLTTHPSSSYDLVVSGDVLPYIGDLEELFIGVSRVLTALGHFMFSVEHHSDEVLVPVLQQSGRFAHSQAYVTSVADKTGWQIIGQTLLDLRRERDEWIQGSIYLMSLSSIS